VAPVPLVPPEVLEIPEQLAASEALDSRVLLVIREHLVPVALLVCLVCLALLGVLEQLDGVERLEQPVEME